MNNPPGALAVLVSGGVDSTVLLAEEVRQQKVVYPLYIRTGLFWESVELQHLEQFLKTLPCPALQPLQLLELPVQDLYGSHWSLTGRGVPDDRSADEAVFLPGRNVLLLAKAMIWCHLHEVPALALALLRSNPFPDATPQFFALYEQAVNEAIQGSVKVFRPYETLSKTEVIRRVRGVPLELTFSCMRPVHGRHCGRCNKCAERRHAFSESGLLDRTIYEAEEPCTA
jgi:7-cyano-7-deazaguanine synthase